jgi:hypothetical protein
MLLTPFVELLQMHVRSASSKSKKAGLVKNLHGSRRWKRSKLAVLAKTSNIKPYTTLLLRRLR